MPIKVFRCEPCNFEYEHSYFDTVPKSMQKNVPPCPLCGKDLTHEELENVENYSYQCWISEGGCGIEFSVEVNGEPTNVYLCPMCNNPAKLKLPGFSIVHGKNMTKGADIDVVIGRNAEQRWSRIHERKAIRDGIRQQTGIQALKQTIVGTKDGGVVAEVQPIKGGQLKAVTVPKSTVNKDE